MSVVKKEKTYNLYDIFDACTEDEISIAKALGKKVESKDDGVRIVAYKYAGKLYVEKIEDIRI